MESRILSAILHSRQAYQTIKDTLREEDFSDQGRIILNHILEYYNNDSSATSVDREIIENSIRRKYPEAAKGLISVVSNLRPVSIPNVLDEYVDVRLHAMAQGIAQGLLSGSPSDDILELMAEYSFLAEKRSEALSEDKEGRVYIGADIDGMFEGLDPKNMIHLSPPSLNKAIGGGVPKGSHIVVFARPEVGKSLFVIDQACNLLREGKKVLFLENEDPVKVTQQRIVSNLLGVNKFDLINSDVDEMTVAADAAGMEHLVLVDVFPGSLQYLKALVRKHKPELVIVNQIRNLSTTKSLTKVEALEYIAQGMRNIAKEFDCVTMSVTQAGDSASYKRYLDIGDVDFSNTGIPSTADLMVAISNQDSSDTHRDINLPKNKLSGKHEGWNVRIDVDQSRFYDAGVM